MKRIWKYPLRVCAQQTVSMPAGAVILSVQVQSAQIVLWAVVADAPSKPRGICIVGTGAADVRDEWTYLGTVQLDNYVWHVFEDPIPF